MTLKAQQLYNSQQALAKLAACDLAIVSFRLARVVRHVARELEDIEKSRVTLVKKHSADGTSVTPENMPAFWAEFGEILSADIELDVKPLEASTLEKATISAQDVLMLDWLIAE